MAGALVDPKATPADKAQSAKAAAGFYAKWLPNLVYGPGLKPGSYEELGEPLASELRFVERSCRKLARSTFYGMSRWQAALEKKQGFLGRLVDIGAELFAMTAVCVRAKMLLDDTKGEGTAGDGQGAVELALLFCRGSRRRVDRLFSELWHNDDDDNYRAAQRVLAGDYTWAEAGILDPSLMSALVPGSEAVPEGET